MDSVDIALLCASLSINNREGPVQVLDGKLRSDARNRLSLSLVGMILSSRLVNRDAFMRVIGKIWQVKHGVDIESISGNIFSFQFRDVYDLDRVLTGGPWSFDNTLIAMEKPEGKGLIDSLSGMIGEVLEVDGGASGDCVGKFMRVRVWIDISGSLKRCLRVNILGDIAETVMVLRYERLPNHCFRCGMINHITSECIDEAPIPVVDGKKVFPFGIWLRDTRSPRNSNFLNNRIGIFFSQVIQMNPESNWRKDKDKKKSVMVDQANTGDQVAAELMGSVKERVTVVSIPDDKVMLQKVEEAVGLTGIESDRVRINGNKLVGETCDMLVEEKCEPVYMANYASSSGPQYVSDQLAELNDFSDSRRSVKVGINDEKKRGKASEAVFGEWVIGPGKSLNVVKPISKPLDANSSLERFSAKIRLSVGIRDDYKNKRGSNIARIRKLGISKDCSKQFYGKRKSVSGESEANFGGRKTRKLDGISAMEDDFNKNKNESVSSRVVTGKKIGLSVLRKKKEFNFGLASLQHTYYLKKHIHERGRFVLCLRPDVNHLIFDLTTNDKKSQMDACVAGLDRCVFCLELSQLLGGHRYLSSQRGDLLLNSWWISSPDILRESS
ncbi:hypothetical protein EZV62_019142 [Acer yangbiense]|uniref:CCHC-type domain-containing protein n=1 Tax=Acer yangbiense TaxID=1000413 RepID=A0A5C7HCI2_9ROSI|nr:hypothetical protein EZV62_019142 [Acer yangbiense]